MYKKARFLNFRGMYALLFATAVLIASSLIMVQPCLAGAENGINKYVGSSICGTCHEKEYNSFIKYAKKARSFESIERVKKGLTDDEIRKCYACHTTGYGKKGGFLTPEKTPHLKNAGCEVCHGPGGLHVKTRDRRNIKKRMTMEDCEGCHIAERVKAFRYKPLIHGGAH
ncbi:MAG: cytochrome c family protein [Nitrospirota bacterium]